MLSRNMVAILLLSVTNYAQAEPIVEDIVNSLQEIIPVESEAPETAILTRDLDKNSYSIGTNIGKRLKKQGLKLDTEDLSQGIVDVLHNNELKVSEEEIKEILDTLKQNQVTLAKKHAGERKVEIQTKNKEFFEQNKNQEGVIALSSGLQYKVLAAGAGESPKPSDQVTVHYRGTLLDGREFDSSYKRNESITFPVNGVIAGWQEALQLMQPGAKWQLFIPPELAYGPRQAGELIEPNSALIFEVELLSVSKG